MSGTDPVYRFVLVMFVGSKHWRPSSAYEAETPSPMFQSAGLSPMERGLGSWPLGSSMYADDCSRMLTTVMLRAVPTGASFVFGMEPRGSVPADDTTCLSGTPTIGQPLTRARPRLATLLASQAMNMLNKCFSVSVNRELAQRAWFQGDCGSILPRILDMGIMVTILSLKY